MREVVDVATSGAPPFRRSADDIVAAGQRRQRRQRLAGAGAACAVVALSVGVAVGLAPGGDEGTPAPAAAERAAPQPFTVPAPPFSFTFKGFEAGRFRIGDPIVASTAYQIAPVYMEGRVTDDKAAEPAGSFGPDGPKGPAEPKLSAHLTLYQPGAFDPAGIRDAERLLVDGRPAIRASGAGAGVDTTRRLLGWQYAEDAWAVLETTSNSATSPSAQDLTAVVARLSGSPAVPAKLPFRMSYVPAGYRPVEIGSGAIAGRNGIAGARDGDFGGAIFAKPVPATTGLTEPYGGPGGADLPGSFTVFVVPRANSNQQPGSTEPQCSNGLCSNWRQDGRVQVQVAGEGRLTNSEMTKILQGITLNDVDNRASWTDATEALLVP